MKERPILFSAPLVRAILEGRKTQTRRVAKVNDHNCKPGFITPNAGFVPRRIENQASYSPFGVPGDRLWVRESGSIALDKSAFMYVDAGGRLAPWEDPSKENWCREWKACPSIFMPRWASRITLEITGVRVERLQEISDNDCLAEGMTRNHASVSAVSREFGYRNWQQSQYAQLWDALNAKRGFGWDVNPWVWVIEFRQLVSENLQPNATKNENAANAGDVTGVK